REIEPHVRGVAALHVHDTGVVDYANVCRALGQEIEAAGVTVSAGTAVLGADERAAGMVLHTSGGPIEAERVVTCAGLHADEVARIGSRDGAVSAGRGRAVSR